jgi:hypothetical protein
MDLVRDAFIIRISEMNCKYTNDANEGNEGNEYKETAEYYRIQRVYAFTNNVQYFFNN